MAQETSKKTWTIRKSKETSEHQYTYNESASENVEWVPVDCLEEMQEVDMIADRKNYSPGRHRI